MSDSIRDLLWKNLKTWDGFLALGLGSGLGPRIPGTWGTLAAVPAALLIQHMDWLPVLALLLGSFIFGVWICGRVGQRLGVADHGAIVWDEFVGYWLCVAFLPAGLLWLLASFVVFRFFDVLKPWPINWIERRVSGGLGVMLDDVLAGLFSLLILLPVAYYFQ